MIACTQDKGHNHKMEKGVDNLGSFIAYTALGPLFSGSVFDVNSLQGLQRVEINSGPNTCALSGAFLGSGQGKGCLLQFGLPWY